MSIQEWGDRLELADLVARYCRAVDRRDFSLLSSLYAADATQDHGAAFSGTAPNFIAWVRNTMVDMDTHHFVGTTIFRIFGDEAEGEIYTVNHHRLNRLPPVDYVAGGRYLDQYVRHDGRWLFAARRRVIDWATEQPASLALAAQGVARGEAGLSDPSYDSLQRLTAALL